MRNARILVVDDEADIRALVAEILTEEGYSVTTAADAAEARAARRESEFELILLDIWMPDIDGITLLKEWSETGLAARVVMMSGHGTVDTAVEATRLGAIDFIEKPVSLAKLLRTVDKALATKRTTLSAGGAFVANAPVGKSDAMRTLRDQIARVAHHDAHTMFCGEPGGGKELAARYLAGQSRRADGPFVAAQGADLDPPTAAAKLLGTETNVGLLRAAAGGVLMINDLPETSQEARRILLNVLRDGHIGISNGSAEQQPFDVRILSCAPPGFDRNDVFGADLLARLSVVVIRIPPLREYVEDVPELLRYYVDVLVDAEHLPFRRFGIAAQNRLRNYPWPGNVRELKNLVRRLLILGGPEEISLADVEAQIDVSTPRDEPLVKHDLLAMPLREAREHFERAYLQQQLQLCDGKVGQLAKRVGMERTHLYRKLRSLGVDFRQIAADD